MAKYTITRIDDEPVDRDSEGRGVVTIEVTFNDGTLYTKRMHADCTDLATTKADVEAWLADYDAARGDTALTDPKVTAAVGKAVTVT